MSLHTDSNGLNKSNVTDNQALQIIKRHRQSSVTDNLESQNIFKMLMHCDVLREPVANKIKYLSK